ncbi:MAG: gliding motility-associated C-terminal domain-containing protein [Chitinophagaceae bacterium]|nr:MAG: gliding motility-associated C-terminal domain-containing protein [Chitinophagaceae bacterium]
MNLRRFLFLFFFVLAAAGCCAQGANANWFFGMKAGLRFSGGTATPRAQGQLSTLEGCASVSDRAGNLLFYTNGVKVWNRIHEEMTNGFDLRGNPSTTQSALIVPVPGSNLTRFYLFTLEDWEKGGALCYSIVDMGLDGGLGDVVPATKNTVLGTNMVEKLAAADGSTCGIWVLTHTRDNNRFEARLVTETGIAAPVYSAVGSIHENGPGGNNAPTNSSGVMKVSRDNSWIGVVNIGGLVELLRFDNSTGIVSDPITMHLPPPMQSYGNCFSPDNSKFYVGSGSPGSTTPSYEILQYDLSVPPAGIPATRTVAGNVTGSAAHYGDLECGPDGRLYAIKMNTTSLAVIPRPNEKAPACGFDLSGLSLRGFGVPQLALPNPVRLGEPHNFSFGPDTTICPGTTLTLSAPPALAYQWSTGATTRSISVSTAGSYWVVVGSGTCVSTDSIEVRVAPPRIFARNDSAVCAGTPLLLDAGAGTDYLWSTGATTRILAPVSNGTYWVRRSSGGCVASDTMRVRFDPPPAPVLGPDTTMCPGTTVMLDAGPAERYVWSTGATTRNIIVSASGTYSVQATNGSCSRAAARRVQLPALPQPRFTGDTVICRNEEVVLDAGGGGRYRWSTGDSMLRIRVREQGAYWVDVRYHGGCQQRFDFNVQVLNCPCQVHLPSAFTPNGDGRNDVFRVGRAPGCIVVRFQVFNRWGQLLFETKDPLRGWDGRLGAEPQGSGVYIWSLTLMRDGREQLQKGSFVLMR